LWWAVIEGKDEGVVDRLGFDQVVVIKAGDRFRIGNIGRGLSLIEKSAPPA